MQKLSLIDRWSEDKDGFSFLENDEVEDSQIKRLNAILNKVNRGNPYHDSEGKFTFSPSGVGKPSRCFSSPTVIYTGDDIKLEKDGVILEGTLQYKDGKFYLLTDKEKGSLIEISKDDIRKSIVSKSAKEKQKELLESQGIRHKSPKERRTPEQKHLISELDKMGLLKDKEFGTWCMKYADEETLSDIYTTLREAENFGLDISSIQLGKIRSGQTWGRAYYRTDGNFKLALSGQIYDRNPIQEMKIKECREGFHTDNSIKAVVRHETGHIISYQNAQRSFNAKDKPQNIWQQEDKIDSYCGKVVSEAMGYSYFTYRETLKDLKKYSNSEISEYGRTNFKEAIAESWSNPNYSLFTKKVSDILKKDLKKPRENSIMNERTEEIPICSGYGPEFEDFEYETSTGKVKTNSRIMRLCSLEKVINSQRENLDYRYDVKAYKEYLKEWLKHKGEKEYLEGGVLSFTEFWEHDIDYEFEDYNKILKLIDEYNKKKELVTNGGPGSGNFNPGQGRGVGKPANKTGKFVKSSFPSLKMSENSKKFYEKLNPKIQESFEKCIDRLKKTNISLDNVELEFVNSNTSGGDNGWVNVVDGDNIDSKMIVNLIKPVLKKFTKKEQNIYKHSFVADNSSEAIIDHEFGHIVMYKKAAEIGIKPKSANLFAEMIVKNEAKKLNVDLNDESTENFSEYAHRNYTEFIAEAYSRPDYSKLTQNVSDSLCNNKYSKDDFKNFIIEMTGIQTNENNSNITRLNAIFNGGPGSGNHNPGQGRGVGKPANGHTSKSSTQYSADKYLTRAEHENIINYSSEDNFTDDELDAIASYTKSMRYGASSDLNQAIKADSNGEITETENILFPEDDSQIVTWKDNKEFIEQKIKDKKKYDSLSQEIHLESSILRKGGLSDEKEIENLKAHISKIQKERDDISKTLKYSEYENYIKNYEEGRYDSIKDDQKMWTIDEDKLSKISIVKLRENQKSDSKRFDEVLEIPRLKWSMSPDDKPTTTDTLANVYQESFNDLDKLDNIIKNKGFVLDKDITVTRRVANAKVIENQIKNKGEYTQNGITSVTAARSIAKKMPSGVNMGDDLLRITIPAGTKVISTYNPFVRDTQKSADKYNGGNLSVEDKRNMRMIKGQNELILPSGSKFVSPNGNSISKNEDGSYQLILKVENNKTSKNSLKIADCLRNNLSAKSYFRSQRLSAILNKVNRGNPYHDEKGRFSSSHGQGSGIDKSGKENNATKIYEKYKDRKNPKPKSLSDEERELRVRTIINNAERMGINLGNIKKDDAYKIMKFIGWEGNEIGTVSTEFGLEKISDKEIKDDDYISFNGADSKDGFDALRDGGYRSKIIDENDGPGIYTSQYYDVALEYSKGKGEIPHEERITAIRINNSNIISRDDVNKKLRNSNRNFLRNLPDSAVAALAGYDAMWTGKGDKEIVILKPSSAEIIELDEE